MAWRKTWLSKSSLNSRLIIYTHVLYFAIYILNTKHTVLSSTVCFTENRGSTCQCINNDIRTVQCLLGNLEHCHGINETRKSYQLFCEVMSQFDCQTKYSVKWNCTHCLDAYTSWLLELSNCTGICKRNNSRQDSLCKDVLAKCPYIAQDGDTPAFDCPP